MTEKDFGELLKYVVQVPGAVAVIFFAVKWVVADWFKKNSEIEKLKAQLENKEIEMLKERVKELDELIKEYMARTVTHSNQIEVAQRSMNLLVERVENFGVKTNDSIKEFARLTHERFKVTEAFNDQLKARMKANAEKSEQIPIGKDSVMVRTKKDE